MSSKIFKKIRKEARIEISKKFEDGLAVLSTMIKPRPKWIPKFIWFIGYRIVFKGDYSKLIYKKII